MKTYVSPTLKFKEFRCKDAIMESKGLIKDVFGSGDSSNSGLW